jgi:hypothetical protein
VRQVSPTPGASFVDLGWLSDEGTTIDPQAQVIEHKDEGGNLSKISMGDTSNRFSSYLAQVGQDEVDFIKNAAGKIYAVRYYGMINPWRFQYKCSEFAQFVPYVARTWKVGKQNLPITAYFIKQDNTTLDIPEYYDAEALGIMYMNTMYIWLSPRRKWNDGTSKILDMSGWALHATLAQTSGGVAGIWQTSTTPERFLRFGGVDGYANFGDAGDIGATTSAVIEFWLRVKGNDGTLQPLVTKKSASGSGAGFWIERSAANYLKFYLSDGSFNDVQTSNATFLKDVWKHVAFVVNRTPQKSAIYVNGVLDSDLFTYSTDLSNAVSFYIARGGSGYGQVDIGDFRLHLQATDYDGTIALSHYNAERAYYGV